jgi:hypothetical protein
MTQDDFRTEQESFWAGRFGSDYIGRNQGDKLLAANLNFFVTALRGARSPQSCIEFGANIGMNLKALKLLYPGIDASAIEINTEAATQLAEVIPANQVFNQSIPYRGHTDRLFKRDFAGEIMERHPSLKLIDYGFAYRNDPNFPQDDITWFLMEKH